MFKDVAIGAILTVMILTGLEGCESPSVNSDKDAKISINVSTEEKINELTPEEEKQIEFAVAEDREQFQKMKNSLVDLNSLYKVVHEMANTKITAEDNNVSGKILMTRPRLEAVEEFMSKNYIYLNEDIGEDNCTILFKGILEWRMGNYSSAAKIHNIVWEKLGRIDGKAKEN